VLDMVKESSKLPSSEATAFKSIKAYGMHLRVRRTEGDKITCDSLVAATFLQPERGTESAMQPTMTPVEYIGWIEEILELNYGGHYVIVLLCSWIKAISEERNATVRRDDYGFTLAKVPKKEIIIGPDSFSFPINVQQVFFADEEGDRDWKIVCRLDIRSRRSPLHIAVDESDVLNSGRNADFVGLNTDFGNYDVVPGEVLPPETVFMLELSST
jgi:hypothetical protein